MKPANRLQPSLFSPAIAEIANRMVRNAAKNEKKAPHSEWSTEGKWFKAFDARYGPFDLDVAAADWNAKCLQYFTKEVNALKRQWWGRAFMNPEYNPAGTIEKFMSYARAQATFNGAVKLVGCLVPHYTAEGWWRRTVVSAKGLGKLLRVEWCEDELGACTVRMYEKLEIRVHEVPGRIRHVSRDGQNDSARYSSAFVVFRRPA